MLFKWPHSIIVILKIPLVLYISCCEVITFSISHINLFVDIGGWTATAMLRNEGLCIGTCNFLTFILDWKLCNYLFILRGEKLLLIVLNTCFMLFKINVVGWYWVVLGGGCSMIWRNRLFCFRIDNWLTSG